MNKHQLIGLAISVLSALVVPGVANADPKPEIIGLTSNADQDGFKLSITGRNFATLNTIHIDSITIPDVPVASKYAITCTTDPACRGGIVETLVLTVPSTAFGDRKVYIENANGMSDAVNLLFHR